MKRGNLSLILITILMVIMISTVFSEADETADLGKYPVRFAILGDRTGGHLPGICGQVVVEIERMKPDFVITVGDMIEGYTENPEIMNREWIEYDSLVSILTMPLYYTPGNHDITTDGMLDTYEKYAGQAYYSFDHRGLHFIILDNSRWNSSDELPTEQIDWLIEDLKSNQEAAYKIVFYHRPFWFETTAIGESDTLHNLFADYGVDAVFTGHYHVYFNGEYDGIKYTAIGSSGAEVYPGASGLQYHFAWVTVDDKEIFISPIKMGAVLPWDEVTAPEHRFFYMARKATISFSESFAVNEGIISSDTSFEVRVSNLNSDFVLEDTLRWEFPKNWEVSPEMTPIKVAAGDTGLIYFSVRNKGDIYPAPALSVRFPYAEGKTAWAERTIPISRQAVCNFAKEKPKIDGRITENIWKNPVTELYAPGGGKMAVDSAYFYFAYDKKNLYLAALCKESKIDFVYANVDEHDGPVYGEDCTGYFFQPDTDVNKVYQIYFNPLGIAFDQEISFDDGYDGNRKWNGEYEVKTFRGENYWSIEARIPVKQLGIDKIKKGQKWGLNFRRKQKRLDDAADWITPIEYDPQGFGRLIME